MSVSSILRFMLAPKENPAAGTCDAAVTADMVLYFCNSVFNDWYEVPFNLTMMLLFKLKPCSWFINRVSCWYITITVRMKKRDRVNCDTNSAFRIPIREKSFVLLKFLSTAMG